MIAITHSWLSCYLVRMKTYVQISEMMILIEIGQPCLRGQHVIDELLPINA